MKPVSDAERVVYHASFESMARAVVLQHDPVLLEQLKAAGFDPAHPQTGYSPETLLRCTELMVAHRYPHLPPDQGYEALGRAVFNGYRSTLVGRVLTAALGVLNPEKLLKLAVRAFATTSNFSRPEVVVVGPRELLYRSRSILPPAYVLGLIRGGLDLSHNPGARLELVESSADDGPTLRITW
jgi:uncharacterized protein (TIGR02265 family)